MKLSSLMRKVSQSFNVQFDQIAREISHGLTSGEAREHFLRRLLEQYLPARVGVDRGFVVDAHGHESRQQDIVLYDRTVGTFFDLGPVRYFPCETVLAVGEVKSEIKSNERLLDALASIASVKALDRSNNDSNLLITGPGLSMQGMMRFDPKRNHRDQIFGFVFTHSSLSKEALVSGIRTFNSRNPRSQWPNLICVHQSCIVSYECEGALYPSAMDAKYLYVTKESEREDLLLLFYSVLATFLNEAHVGRPEYFAYAGIKETSAEYYDLVHEGTE